ncbi:hypothetical protein NPX13_g49 [Xylaria arbuscula]|uniref:Uncharacterized protein n=1 Tax=Xylaria arbuscula TaxID=114810 RepID=A0A9W8TQV7_9PEZI|nr:hypothetical protein NPX13_g49 [Xylaria arbuscula]
MFQAASERMKEPLDWMELFTINNEWDQYEYQDAITALAELSLIQYRTSEEVPGKDDLEEDTSPYSFSFHPLVRDWIQLRIPSSERRTNVLRALETLRYYVESSGIDYTKWTLKERRAAMSHIDACMETLSKYVRDRTDEEYNTARGPLTVFYKFYADDGRYPEAEAVCRQILDYDKRLKGGSSEAYVESEIRLASIRFLRGAFSEAEGILARLRPGVEQYSEEIRISLLKNLAKIFFKLGRYDEALQLYHDVIARTPEQPNTTIAQSRASLHDSAPDHPIALSARLVRAINLRELNRTEEAEDAFRDTVERFGRILGPFHQDTLRAIMNFGILYDRTNRPEQAEDLYRAALVGREKIMGFDNQYTMRTVERLVSLLWSQDRCDEAEALALRALRAQRNSPLEGDMSTLNIGESNDDGNAPYRPVEVLFTQAVERDRKLLGETHTDRIEAERSLAAVYMKQRRISDEENRGVEDGCGSPLLVVVKGQDDVDPPPYSTFEDTKKTQVNTTISQTSKAGRAEAGIIDEGSSTLAQLVTEDKSRSLRIITYDHNGKRLYSPVEAIFAHAVEESGTFVELQNKK